MIDETSIEARLLKIQMADVLQNSQMATSQFGASITVSNVFFAAN